MIEYLFGTTDDNGRCAEDEVREEEQRRRPREGAREREGTRDGGRSARGVIIKVTHTLLNGSCLDHRQAGAMPPSDTKGCAGRGCHGGFN